MCTKKTNSFCCLVSFKQHVARHFKTLPVVEKETLTFFIYMAKNYKSRLDQKHLETVNS